MAGHKGISFFFFLKVEKKVGKMNSRYNQGIYHQAINYKFHNVRSSASIWCQNSQVHFFKQGMYMYVMYTWYTHVRITQLLVLWAYKLLYACHVDMFLLLEVEYQLKVTVIWTPTEIGFSSGGHWYYHGMCNIFMSDIVCGGALEPMLKDHRSPNDFFKISM